MRISNDPRVRASLRALESANGDTMRACLKASSVLPPAWQDATPNAAPSASVRETPEERPRPRLMLLGVFGVLGIVACPRLPPVANCAPGAMVCQGDQPRVCSASQRWEPAGDRPCSAVGGVCALDDAGVARCVRRGDGGGL